MWIDICYTTAYTSRLTSPSYEKPIDTVKQFLAHGKIVFLFYRLCYIVMYAKIALFLLRYVYMQQVCLLGLNSTISCVGERRLSQIEYSFDSLWRK